MVMRHYAVITQNYKLVHFYYDTDEWELYDLKKDSHEMNNVYDNPAYSETVKKLKSKLRALRKKYKDSTALDNRFIKIYREEGLING